MSSARRVESVELVRVRLPLRDPLESAHGVESVRDVVLVGALVDGVEGWGECPSLSRSGYSAETTDVAWRALVDMIGPGVVSSQRGDEVDEAAARFPMATGALRDAVLDAGLRAAGVALSAHLAETAASGRPTSTVESCRVVGVDQAIGDGDGWLKVKITPATFDRLRRLCAEQPDRPIAADANGSFASVDEIPDDLDDLGLEYIEQPLPPSDLAGHAELRRRHRTPVALDEAIGGIGDLERALAVGAVDVVSLKPARLGGVDTAVRTRIAVAGGGAKCFVGGMLETGIGRATALALASTVDDGLPTDLGGSARYFDRDVCEPLTGTATQVDVPTGPGCGRTPDRAVVAEYAVDQVTIRA